MNYEQLSDEELFELIQDYKYQAENYPDSISQKEGMNAWLALVEYYNRLQKFWHDQYLKTKKFHKIQMDTSAAYRFICEKGLDDAFTDYLLDMEEEEIEEVRPKLIRIK